MIQISKFKELKNLLPKAFTSSQHKFLRKWFSLAQRLKVEVFVNENKIIFKKTFAEDVYFYREEFLNFWDDKIYFDFSTWLKVDGQSVSLPIKSLLLSNGKYVFNSIYDVYDLIKIKGDLKVVKAFYNKSDLLKNLVKSSSFKKLNIKGFTIYMCVDDSIGLNVGTIIDERSLYDSYSANWIAQGKEGASYLLKILCENYPYSIRYTGDISSLSLQQVNELYYSEINNYKCQSNGKMCQRGCSFTCFNEDIRTTKSKTKDVLISLIQEYQHLNHI